MADNELGVEDLAKFMKRSPATVRALLRDRKVKKTGKSYSWSNKSALQTVAKKLGGNDSPAPAKAKKKASASASAA